MKESPEFIIAKGMPIGSRMAFIAILAIVGVVIQLYISVFLGWLLVLLAVLIGSMRGRSNDPGATGRGEWQPVTMEELDEAQKLLNDTSKAAEDTGTISVSSPSGLWLGFLLVMGFGLACLIIWGLADNSIAPDMMFDPPFRGGWVSYLFAVDSVTLIAPLWLFGGVKFWQPPYIELRLSQLMYIYNKFKADSTLTFQPNMLLAKGKKGMVPLDYKLMVNFKDAYQDFMGIQVQTSLNDVQGRKYSYTYCVLIAKPAFGLVDKVTPLIEIPPDGAFSTGLFADSNTKKEAVFARYGDALVELKREGEVDIAVVRQNTSGTGYSTSNDQAAVVFAYALQLAKMVNGKHV